MKESMEGRENGLFHSYNNERNSCYWQAIGNYCRIGTTHDNIYFISFSIHLKQE